MDETNGKSFPKFPAISKENPLTRNQFKQTFPASPAVSKTKPEAAAVPWPEFLTKLELKARGILNHGQYSELITDVICDGRVVAEMAVRATKAFYNLFPVWIFVPGGPPENSGYSRVRYVSGARHVGPVAEGHPLEDFAPRFESSVQALRIGLDRPKSIGVAAPGGERRVGFIWNDRNDCRCLPMVAAIKNRPSGRSIFYVDWYADFRRGARGELHHVASSRMSFCSALCLAIWSQLFAKSAVLGGGWFPVPLGAEDKTRNDHKYWELVPCYHALPPEIQRLLSQGRRLAELDLCKAPNQVLLKAKGDSFVVVQRPGIGGKLRPATTRSFVRVSNLTL